ncbi:hypothetical protein [Burkholderia cenocepacia]|uniref:hypothetical protein n=1 Tax=Burkholderia cenocepacia TaxID=95486 RepID=UPI000847A4B2|nr:hypothetical protein [Burkholderia cenocepacia]
MQIESFGMQPLQAIIQSYLYKEYQDDPSLQAFVDSFNGLSQGYLDWFNQTPLGLYTSPFINGPLLDWIGNGVYGIPRPVLSTQSSTNIAGFDSAAFNKVAFNGYIRTSSGTAELANDDVYKRAMTWNLYRGDGQMFTMGWLKNRVCRFINGVNGTDYPVLNNPPSITVSGNTFTITSFEDSVFSSMQACIANNVLAVPFQYKFTFVNVSFLNDDGVLWMTSPLNYPTSPMGLPAGAVWYNGGIVSVIPGGSGAGAPVYFGSITAAGLLALGGGGLPTSNPGVHNQLWNNGGVISIA